MCLYLVRFWLGITCVTLPNRMRSEEEAIGFLVHAFTFPMRW